LTAASEKIKKKTDKFSTDRDITFREHVVKKYYGPYLGFIAMTAKAISQKQGGLTMLISCLAVQYGLTNNGLDILHHFNYAIKHNTFNTQRTRVIDLYTLYLLGLILDTDNLTVWVDNFTKYKYSFIGTVERGVYKSANYAGVAALQGSPANDLRFQFIPAIYADEQPTLLPAFPHKLHDTFWRDEVYRWFAPIRDGGDNYWMDYYATSFSVFENVTLLPLKLQEDQVSTPLVK
jgi:hypothetical protein